MPMTKSNISTGKTQKKGTRNYLMMLELRRIYDYLNEFIDAEYPLTNEQFKLILDASSSIGLVILQLEEKK